MSVREVIHTDKAPPAIGPYSQAIVSGDTVYTSGQIPLDPETGNIVEGGIEAQTHRTFDNLVAVLEAAGSDLAHTTLVTVYLTSLKNFQTVNGIYAERFGSAAPSARVCVEVPALPKDSLIEISAIAVRKGR